MLKFGKRGSNITKTKMIHGRSNIQGKAEKNYRKGKEKQVSTFDVMHYE